MHGTIAQARVVEVAAPDGAAALELEKRLAHLTPTTIAHGGSWVVELRDVDSIDELAVVVREWLDIVGADATTITVDGETRRLAGRHGEGASHRATHRHFIG